MRSFIRPTFRIETAAFLFCAQCLGRFPFLQKLFADGGYQGPIFCEAQKKALPSLVTEIVKRSDTAKGFEVLPRRWVVERTFSWLGRCRRLAKDWGMPQPKGARISAHRLNPPHAQKAMQSNMMFADNSQGGRELFAPADSAPTHRRIAPVRNPGPSGERRSAPSSS